MSLQSEAINHLAGSTGLHGLTFLEPRWFMFMTLVPIVIVIALIGRAVAQRRIKRMFGEGIDRPWALAAMRQAFWLPVAFIVVAITGIVLALVRPALDPTPRQVTRSGRDVVFILDVSRSMLAQDLRPSRLERATLAVRDVLDVAEGDRIGLVAFAGAAVVRAPLTTDYSFVRMGLDELTPETVGRGGTALGDGIREGLTQLLPSGADKADGRSRIMVLLTDGEDHESMPIQAAEEAGKSGIRIITVGLGSDLSGSAIPAADQPARQNAPSQAMQFAGQEVRTRMDATILRSVAEATPGGVFIPVGTGNVEMDQVYKRLIRTAKAASQESSELLQYTEVFQLGLLLAVIALTLDGVRQLRLRTRSVA